MNKSESKYFNTALLMDEALIRLLEVKDYEYITVKEICEKAGVIGAARIKQHKNVFRKRRSFGYAVSPFCRSISKDAGSIPTRS